MLYKPCIGCMITPDKFDWFRFSSNTCVKVTDTLFCRSEHNAYHIHGTIQFGLGNALLKIADETFDYIKANFKEPPIVELWGSKYWKLAVAEECNSIKLIECLVSRRAVITVCPNRLDFIDIIMYPVSQNIDLRDWYKNEGFVKSWVGDEEHHKMDQICHGNWSSLRLTYTRIYQAQQAEEDKAQRKEDSLVKSSKPSIFRQLFMCDTPVQTKYKRL
jgi:hypothetical protein